MKRLSTKTAIDGPVKIMPDLSMQIYLRIQLYILCMKCDSIRRDFAYANVIVNLIWASP